MCASAWEATEAAIRRAGVELRAIETLEEIAEVSALLGGIWERPGEPPMPTELLRAFAHSGNYVMGAYRDGRLVGSLVGFLGRHDSETHLHSHILGVRGDARVHGVGFALKLHQRAWALARDIDTIVWTFDPLARANAFFNLAKLGAVGHEYEVDFYGSMPDVINEGDESDRLVVRWHLAEPAVADAAAGVPLQPDVEALKAAGATVALAVGADGSALVGEPVDGEPLLMQIPEDVVSLRRRDAAAAMAWRRALRRVVTRALANGLTVSGVTRDGWFVLDTRRG